MPVPSISVVTSKASTKTSPVVLYNVILPLTASTISSKVITRLEPTATGSALSAGDNVVIVGSVTSAEVKFQVVLSAIPAKLLSDGSSKAAASILT